MLRGTSNEKKPVVIPKMVLPITKHEKYGIMQIITPATTKILVINIIFLLPACAFQN